ncbi:adenylosuccinate synthetase [Candidatus Woesearchaeota archaeon]|nr:adenylosuccinate synthetase [Candidatus Woesearchaeota archaeon]
MSLDNLLKNINVLAIVCNQWGDTGKGKFVDYFSEWADIIARGTGGANAGHTIVINDKQYVFHLVPSGIIYDSKEKINIIGNGVAFDPFIMKKELELLVAEGLTHNHLMISLNAKLVLPHHLILDRLVNSAEGQTKIGTTGKGIGPLYEDHIGRRGLIVNDMLNPDIFVKKLKANLEHNLILLKSKDPEKIKEVLHQKDLGNGIFYDMNNILNIDIITDVYREYGKFFKEMISNTELILKSSLGSKKILLEGAQGHLLSIDHGSYPFVTSSDCSIDGLAKGTGLHTSEIDFTLGIVKAFYMTRVGEGPFPTELGGTKSAEWCKTHRKKDEEDLYKNANVNSLNEFEQGIGIRFTGKEYGATTGRPRRTGWLDLPLLRYSTIINGPNIVLSKVDVLNDCDKIKICTGYVYEGPNYNNGNETLKTGDIITVANVHSEVLEHCKPIYIEFSGWKSDISGIKQYSAVPHKLRRIISFIEFTTGTDVRMISVGPDRDQTIIKE